MNEFLLVAGVHFMALISPGPDFAMVIRNSLVYSRRTGILAALGLGLGMGVHVSYSLLGIGLLISQSIILFNAIKLIGAAYLIYIGVRSLLSTRKTPKQFAESVEEEVDGYKSKKDLTKFQAIKMGFLTNVLNPKATLFMVALFTQVIDSSTPLIMKMAYGIEMMTVGFLWFAIVAVVMSHSHIKRGYNKFKHHFERAFGAVLIALGVRIALGDRE